jgi:HD-like signal output (HDOD) protein
MEDQPRMSSHFWQRFFSGFRPASRSEAGLAGPCVVDAEPGPGCASEAAQTSGLRDPADSLDTPEDSPETIEAVRASLGRSLEWRVQVLLERSSPTPRLGDGPALVASLRGGGEELIRQIPFAAQRALAVSRNPTSGVADLVKLFEQDPTLTQSLLQTANSSWYSRGDEVVISIAAAVQRIGYRAVENLLLASIVGGMLCRPGGAYTVTVGKVWSHMLRTAPLAQRLAAPFGVDPETAYTLGLLHDVGKLAVFDHISALRGDLRREVKMPEPFLFDLLTHLHEPIGGRAVLRWGLDGGAARAVAGHHRSPAPERPDTVTELLFVAERVDLAVRARFEKPDWEAIWQEGAITTDRTAVEESYAEE